MGALAQSRGRVSKGNFNSSWNQVFEAVPEAFGEIPTVLEP